MKINTITITGADDQTPLKELINLSTRFPFVEWGILFSKTKMGQSRYPSQQWIDVLLEEKPLWMNISAHLCGQYPRDILQNGDFSFFNYFNKAFRRAQINFNFSTTEFKSEHLIRFLSIAKQQKIILQYNKSNKQIVDFLMNEKYDFDVLYDASGGRGTEIKQIQNPFVDHYTGYSGGLSPDNIESFCQSIINYPIDNVVFLDCESGVRNEMNELDLNKVEKYLEICSKFINI